MGKGSPSNKGRGSISGINTVLKAKGMYIPAIFHGNNVMCRGCGFVEEERVGGRGRGLQRYSGVSLPHLPQFSARLRPLVMWVELCQL